MYCHLQMMRALAFSVPVCVLLLSVAAVTSSPQSGDSPVDDYDYHQSGDSPVVYEDECSYRNYNQFFKCGSECLSYLSLCNCSGTILAYEEYPTSHCCSDAQCSWNGGSVTIVTCDEGEVVDINSPCQGQGSSRHTTNATVVPRKFM